MTILHRVLLPLQRCGLMLGMLGILAGCGKTALPVEVNFLARYGDSPISCTEAANGLQLTDLRLYVHDLKLTDSAGREFPLALDADGAWQDGSVALLDLEDGQGACINGSAAGNSSVRGQVHGVEPGQRLRAVSFTVGVPPQSNHGDPLGAGPPLNYTSMHWHWLSGYKFLRAGVGNASDHFWVHLGSSHCDGNIGAGIHCRTPNRVGVVLEDFDPWRDRIVIDLMRLTEGVDLTDGSGSDCSSGPDELPCGSVFAMLGLPFGPATDAPRQQVFRSERAP